VKSRTFLILVIQCLLLAGCAVTVTPPTADGKKAPVKPGPGQYEVFGKIYDLMPSSLGYLEIGIASWYGKKFHGRLTAMGEVYDMYGITAAHKALPLPTMVRVTNLDNGRDVVLRVNDRGPFHEDRLIDLSYAAARRLGFDTQGTAPVVVEAIDEVNYPELAAKIHKDNYYLQAGAFQRRQGAEEQLKRVKDALPVDVQVRILTSETSSGLLYKVWVGPLESIREEEIVAERIRDRNLGSPVRVTVGSE
jgi:rare lipoprotein A